jgi:hypothetical protein
MAVEGASRKEKIAPRISMCASINGSVDRSTVYVQSWLDYKGHEYPHTTPWSPFCVLLINQVVCIFVCWWVCVCVRLFWLICHHAGQRQKRPFTRPGQSGVLRRIPALSSRAQLLKREDFGEQLGAGRHLLSGFSRPACNDDALCNRLPNYSVAALVASRKYRACSLPQRKTRLSPSSGCFVWNRPTDRQWLLSHQDKSQGTQNQAGPEDGLAARFSADSVCVCTWDISSY